MPRTGPETLLRRASDSPREENRWESGSTCREARRRRRARWRRGGTGVACARGSRAESAARTRGRGRGCRLRLGGASVMSDACPGRWGAWRQKGARRAAWGTLASINREWRNALNNPFQRAEILNYSPHQKKTNKFKKTLAFNCIHTRAPPTNSASRACFVKSLYQPYSRPRPSNCHS